MVTNRTLISYTALLDSTHFSETLTDFNQTYYLTIFIQDSSFQLQQLPSLTAQPMPNNTANPQLHHSQSSKIIRSEKTWRRNIVFGLEEIVVEQQSVYCVGLTLNFAVYITVPVYSQKPSVFYQCQVTSSRKGNPSLLN